MRFYLRKNAKLFVRTLFEIPCSASEADSDMVYICPEEDLSDSLLKMKSFDAPESRICRRCITHIKLLSSRRKLKAVQTTRCLGKGEWPYDRRDTYVLCQIQDPVTIYLH